MHENNKNTKVFSGVFKGYKMGASAKNGVSPQISISVYFNYDYRGHTFSAYVNIFQTTNISLLNRVNAWYKILLVAHHGSKTSIKRYNPANIYLFKVNNRNTRKKV